MGVTPIPSPGRVQGETPAILDREVSPTVAVDRTGRMSDDSYEGQGEAAQRGLEDEDEQTEQGEEECLDSPGPGRPGGVNFFA